MKKVTRAEPKRRYAPRMPLEARREQLMDAALHVLVHEGYAKLSVEAIAREAEVTRPVVYSAYDGLEPLLLALLDRTQARAFTQVLEILDAAGRPDDVDAWLLRAVGHLIDQVQEDPEVWRPILGLTRGAPEVVLERIEATRDLIRTQLAAALRSGLERRGGPDLDAEVLAHLILVGAEEYGRLVLEDPPRFSRERLLAALRGLLAAAPAPSR